MRQTAPLDYNQDLNQSHLKFRNDISAIKKIWGTLISFQSNSDYTSNRESLIVSPDVFASSIGATDGTNSFQELSKILVHSKNRVSISKKYSQLTISPQVGLNYSLENLTSAVNPQNEVAGISDSLQSNHLALSNISPYLSLKTEYKHDRWRASFNLPLLYRNYWITRKPFEKTQNSISLLNLEPKFDISYEINYDWKIFGSAEIQNDFGHLNRMHEGFILKSYRDLQRFEAPLEEMQSRIIGGRLQYRNPIQAMFWSFRYSYGFVTSNIQEKYTYNENGATLISAVAAKTNSTRQMASMDISKYFQKANTTVYSKSTIMQSIGRRLLNAESAAIENINFNYSIGGMGQVLSFIEYDYSFQQEFSQNSINNKDNSSLRSDKHEVEIDFFLNNSQYFGIQFQSNNTVMTGESTGFNHFMNLSYNYSFSKTGVDLTAEWRNVFDTQYYTNVYGLANRYLRSSYEMRPMQFLVKAQFSLGALQNPK